MESIDLCPVEINGADDSLVLEDNRNGNNNDDLLLHSHIDTTNSAIHFACSPLQPFGSKSSSGRNLVSSVEASMSNGEVYSSAVEEVDDKENCDGKNLSAQRSNQEAKRRKKKGGYNLRKSLAWNSAFFTEEGVLDSQELSRLSNKPIRRPGTVLLSGISEEASLPPSLGGANERADQSASKENSHTRSSKKGGRVGGALLPKPGSSSAQKGGVSVSSASSNAAKGSQKVQIAKTNNSRSTSHLGRGCPKPIGSSSRKELPSSNVRSAPVRHLKLPQFPVSKPESSSVSTASKNAVLGTRRSSCNQRRPSVHVQKNNELRVTTSTKMDCRRISSTTKSSVLCSGKTMVKMGNSSLAADVSTNLKPPLASKCSSIGAKETSNSILPSDKHAPIVLPADKGGNIQSLLLQPLKPSCLRMPSPSLGYFDQKKASASPIIDSSSNFQLHNHREWTNPTPRKLHYPNPNSEMKTATANSLMLPVEGSGSAKFVTVASGSTLKCWIPSITTTTSHPTLKANLEINSFPVDLKRGSNTSMSNNQTLSEKSFQATHENFVEQDRKQMGGDKLHVQTGSSVQTQGNNHVESIMEVCQQRIGSNGNDLELLQTKPELNSERQVKSVALLDSLIEHELGEDKRVDLSSIDDPCGVSGRDSVGGIIVTDNQVNLEMKDKGVARVDNLLEHQNGEETGIYLTSVNNHEAISVREIDEFSSVTGTLVMDGHCSEVGYDVNTQLAQADIRKPMPNDIDESQHEWELFHDPSQVNSVMHDTRSDSTTEYWHRESIRMDVLASNSHSNCLSEVCVTDRQSAEQAALRDNSNGTEDVMSADKHEEVKKAVLAKPVRQVDDSLKDRILGNFITSPEDREASGRVMQSCDILSLTSSTLQMKERSSGECSTMDNQLEDSQFKALDGNLLVDNHYNFDEQLGNSTNGCTTSIFSRVVKDVDEQTGKEPEPREKCFDECEPIITSKCDVGLQPLIRRGTEKLMKDHNPDNKINVSSERQDPSGAEVDGSELHLHREDMCLDPSGINFSVENQKSIHGMVFIEPLSKWKTDQIAADSNSSSLISFSDLNSSLDLSDKKTEGRTKPLGEEGNGSSSEDTENDLSLRCQNSNGDLQYELEKGVAPMEDNNTKMIQKRKSTDDIKPVAPAVKIKLNAVPFSDEWLSALEAVGEDVLTMKTGAVQNSPPEKPLPEPNPWSPVKRKYNKKIGPFDCTKYTNASQPHLQ